MPTSWRSLLRRPSVQRGGSVAAGVLFIAGLALLSRGPREGTTPRAGDMAGEPPPIAEAAVEPIVSAPVEEWSVRFRELQARRAWETLDEQLDEIRDHRPDLFESWDLAYLQARTRIEAGDLDGAADALEPYLREGHALRDLALYHRARIADAEEDLAEAAEYREQLILQYPGSAYRSLALEAHLDWLEQQGDPAPLRAFASRLTGAGRDVHRDIESRLVLLEAQQGEAGDAVQRGLRLLRDKTGDDAGDRVLRALDKPAIVARLGAEEKVLLGEAARDHRRYDRAVELLSAGLGALPARREDLLYGIGRAHFGAERFKEAEDAYLQGAAITRSERKAFFYYNASRAAQLMGDDRRGEAHLAQAIAHGGRTSRAGSALVQRIRTRLAQGRLKDAESDLKRLRKDFRNSRSHYEGALAWAAGMIANDRGSAARSALQDVPRKTIERADEPEVAYWTGRSWEGKDPAKAVAAWSDVLMTTWPTHFDVFVRQRLEEPRLRRAADERIRKLRTQANAHLEAGRHDEARKLWTEIYLLSPTERQQEELRALADIYRRLPVYKDVLELARQPLPRLPLPVDAEAGSDGLRVDRHDLLLALGLVDDAADLIPDRYGLAPAAIGMTRAQALALAGSTRGSISAAESTMKRVPDEFLADLLPPGLRVLLYPREYWDRIDDEARRHGADPRLVISIMREESRFNERAKSPAAARGLLQFIIGTARDVGRAIGLLDVQPEDLYDPEVIIRLGARYVADLQEQFGGDGYRTAAAYNAGPAQVRLWTRLQPGAGHDYFLTAINFDETKNYVRKVMNSYHRYAEVYGPNMDRRVDLDAAEPIEAEAPETPAD